MLKLSGSAIFCLAVLAAAAQARPTVSVYGPAVHSPSGTAADLASSRYALPASTALPREGGLMTAAGVRIVDGGARRSLAPNVDLAVEGGRGLIDEYGKPQKPVRLLFRLGREF